MARREEIRKPEYRFVPYDDTIHTWGVWDRLENKPVRQELRSSSEAREIAEQLNINPSLAYPDQEASS